MFWRIHWLTGLGLLISVGSCVAAQEAELLFVRRIQPLFAEKCLACHGKEAPKFKGGLDMRTLQSVLKGGESGQPALVVGKAEQSPLYLSALRTHEEWEAMPPKEADKLYAEQLQWLSSWINAGAPWPDEARVRLLSQQYAEEWKAEDGAPVQTSGGLSADWTQRPYKPEGLWAYQPVREPQTPATGHPIDVLLQQRMPAGVTPAGDCDPRSFIRRATLDLTGLPPTPEEVADFEKDCAGAGLSQGVVAGLIERLLQSAHYGERMAQHWLDVTRYADSSGFANDYERGNAWRYRDYVVRAFNEDKPYDLFVKEQIAGDEIQHASPEQAQQAMLATGFLRMGPWELTGMEVAKVARQRFLDDVTNSVGETFLAHSLQCARCHDHKFDPIPTRDYYSMQAVFGTTQLVERAAPFLRQENLQGFEEKRYLEMRRLEHMAVLRELDAVLLKNAEAWYAEKKQPRVAWDKAVAAAQQALAKAGGKAAKGKRSFQGIFDTARAQMQKQFQEDEYPPKLVGFTPEQFGKERVARKGLERLKWELERYEPYALAVYNGRTPEVKAVYEPVRMPAHVMQVGELEQTCILTGGDPFAAGEKVQPGVLSALNGLNPKLPVMQAGGGIQGRRSALAEWIAHPANPLTTRTLVNRLWLWHFGQALAGNPNNFGSTGKRPTHPELLDFLAALLVKQQWSIKAMHRLIMTSAAYRRSSALEAKLSREELEKSYAVFKPRRLSAEELRDTMLSVTGELNATLGGVPNRPEINLEAALQPRMVMGTFASAWVPNQQPQQRHRRSLYALKLRGLVDPAMEVFNAPAPDFSCEAREASTVTPQVFSLFNSQGSYSRALALAARAVAETQSDEAALQRVFALVYNRSASPQELAEALSHWQEQRVLQEKKQPAASSTPPLQVRREAVEENTGEKFSFQEKLHAYADFTPDLQPAQVDARTRALAELCLVLLNSNEFAYVY